MRTNTDNLLFPTSPVGVLLPKLPGRQAGTTFCVEGSAVWRSLPCLDDFTHAGQAGRRIGWAGRWMDEPSLMAASALPNRYNANRDTEFEERGGGSKN